MWSKIVKLLNPYEGLRKLDEKEVWEAIRELSDIRAGYNLFDEKESGKYHACTVAIKALRAIIRK